MAAKVEDGIHTEQSTRVVFLEHRRRIIYHTAFSCKNLGERKKKVKKQGRKLSNHFETYAKFLRRQQESCKD